MTDVDEYNDLLNSLNSFKEKNGDELIEKKQNGVSSGLKVNEVINTIVQNFELLKKK